MSVVVVFGTNEWEILLAQVTPLDGSAFRQVSGTVVSAAGSVEVSEVRDRWCAALRGSANFENTMPHCA